MRYRHVLADGSLGTHSALRYHVKTRTGEAPVAHTFSKGFSVESDAHRGYQHLFMLGASVSKSFGNGLSFFPVAWFVSCSAEK